MKTTLLVCVLCASQMGLPHARDTFVGDPLRKGISGGERKRLCVAQELVTKPLLLFMDEVCVCVCVHVYVCACVQSVYTSSLARDATSTQRYCELNVCSSVRTWSGGLHVCTCVFPRLRLQPTSGLDSVNALALMTTMRGLTDARECTVVTTIHQPQAKIFALFSE